MMAINLRGVKGIGQLMKSEDRGNCFFDDEGNILAYVFNGKQFATEEEVIRFLKLRSFE